MENEKWVDLKTLSKHTGMGYMMLRDMADEGTIPCFPRKTKKTIRRFFKLSMVDAALASMSSSPQVTE